MKPIVQVLIQQAANLSQDTVQDGSSFLIIEALEGLPVELLLLFGTHQQSATVSLDSLQKSGSCNRGDISSAQAVTAVTGVHGYGVFVSESRAYTH